MTLTVAAGAFLLVSAHRSGSNTSVSGVIANGNALTRIAGVGGAQAGVEVWCLTAPPTGVLSISANFAATDFWQITCGSWLGVKASSSTGPSHTGSASVVTLVSSISTTLNDMVCFFATGAAAFSASNLTTDLKAQPHYGVFVGHIAGATDAVSVSMIGAGAVSFNMAFAGLNLHFSATVASAPSFRMMQRVGV